MSAIEDSQQRLSMVVVKVDGSNDFPKLTTNAPDAFRERLTGLQKNRRREPQSSVDYPLATSTKKYSKRCGGKRHGRK
jgi:hypothetical protein